jgi:SOS-response transcriptional repressor LexA
VARVADHGYVVKKVTSLKKGRVELASFNPRYESIVIPRERSSILGTVIARFKRE